MRRKRRNGDGHKTLIDEQDNLLGNVMLDRLNRLNVYMMNSGKTPNDIYWVRYRFGIADRGISMINLRYVEYMDTQFYIKPFKKG
jgi:hypothetical protein